LRIGIDFDNTIVGYDEVMYRIASERGLVGGDGDLTKRTVRDRIRQLPDGEIEWQKLQALAYGPRMGEAVLLEGADEFIRRCRRAGVDVCIVSHKTLFANYDETRTDLRAAAMAWMTARRFFEPDGLGLRCGDVYFESTRAAKIARVAQIGCSHFIDDLVEVFLEPSFPSGVQKILLAPDAAAMPAAGAAIVPGWRALCDYFFNGGH
jgi:hypothetical protein